MHRWVLIAAFGLCLSGCTHYANLTPNDFERGHASHRIFSRDNYNCQVHASIAQNEVRGSDPHGVYNDAYVACMEKLGYQTSSVDFIGFGG